MNINCPTIQGIFVTGHFSTTVNILLNSNYKKGTPTKYLVNTTFGTGKKCFN
jgi:hypothetical protein